jgi:DNA-binding transcriptional ArsR family regulator
MASTAEPTTTEPQSKELYHRDESEDRPVVANVNSDSPPHLELMADDYALAILETLTDGPKRGRELTDACRGSRSTVYRRLNRLVEAGFVTEETALDSDGHHCKRFRLVRDTVTVTIDHDGLTVTAYRE